MVAFFQPTFSNAFSWMKIYEFRLTFHWSLFPRVQLTIIQHWFRWWLGAEQATSLYLNQCWSSFLTHICVTRPQRVKQGSLTMATSGAHFTRATTIKFNPPLKFNFNRRLASLGLHRSKKIPRVRPNAVMKGCVESLRLVDAYRRQQIRSYLAQIMAWCWMQQATSHYLD